MHPFRLSAQSAVFHLLFVLLLAALLAFKWNDLHLPYFWDELGVYGQAAIHFYQQGPSLQPGSISPEISRGHPLLFQFLSGWALRLLGNNPFAAHLFALSVSFALLTAVYLKIAQLYNRATAFAASLILAVQPAFLAICCLLLPEVMLTLWAWLGVTHYYQRHYARAGLYVCLAVLTKETAISLPVVFLSFSLLHYLLYRDHRGAFKPLALLFTLTPIAVLTAFLLLQKQQNGWYFFPYHLSTVTTNVQEVFVSLLRYFRFLFLKSNRCVLLALLAVAAFRTRISIESGRNNVLLPLVMMSAAVVIGSCFAFYMARYVMLVFPVLALLAALSLRTIFSRQLHRALALLVVLLVALLARNGTTFHYEDDLAYRKSVTTVQQAIRYTQSIATDGDTIIARFPVYYALMTPDYGYTTRFIPSLPPDSLYWKKVYYIDSDPGVNEPLPWPDSLFVPVKEFRDGYARATVYQLLITNRQQLFLR